MGTLIVLAVVSLAVRMAFREKPEVRRRPVSRKRIKSYVHR